MTLPMADTARIESRLQAILNKTQKRSFCPQRRHALPALSAIVVLLLTLGALHPGTSPLNASDSGAALAAGLENAPWTRRTPDGKVSVELVGVSLRSESEPIPPHYLHQSDFRRTIRSSWRPSGTPFSRPLYLKGLDWHDPTDPVHNRSLEFALRIDNKSSRAVNLADNVGGALFPIGKDPGNEFQVDGFPKSDIFWAKGKWFPRQQRNTRLRLQVVMSSGDPFKIDRPIPPGDDLGGYSETFWYKGTTCTVTWGQLIYNNRKDYGFVVGNSALPSCDTDVVAVDRQGQEVSPSEGEGQSGGGYKQSTVFFDSRTLPRSQIAALRFKVLPYNYHWIEFDNVALYPKGSPTHGHIEGTRGREKTAITYALAGTASPSVER